MRLRHMVLAALTSVIWGFGFIAVKFGLQSFSAPQLTAVRFLIACLPIVLVPRPPISWVSIVLIGMTQFTGQFLLLFCAYTQGLPPGLASVTQQMQAFFTVLLAAVFLRDVPSLRQCIGMTVAFAGLALIGLTTGADLKLTALSLALAGACSWAVGNVLVKRMANVPMFPLVVWCSLIPPWPALLVARVSAPHLSLLEAVFSASWLSLGAVVYLGVMATIVAYATWGTLLQRYPAGVVAPFALLAPCTGVVSSALIFGEVFSPMRYAGMALILVGLAVIVLPADWVGWAHPGRWLGTPCSMRAERVCSPTVVALAGLAALAVAMGIGRFAFTPILPMMQVDAELSVAAGGWLASANYLGSLLGAVAAIAVRVAAPTAIRGGLVTIGIATLAMALEHRPTAWVVLRALAGIATAWVCVFASAWALERLTPLRRPILTTTVFAGYGVGIAAAGSRANGGTRRRELCGACRRRFCGSAGGRVRSSYRERLGTLLSEEGPWPTG